MIRRCSKNTLQNNMKNIVLVTGGSRGIGKEICKTLAFSGYTVAINYNNSEEKAEELKAEILSGGGICEIFKCDVGNSAEVKNMFSCICEELGEVSFLVNNAGISEQSLFTDITDDMWQRMINTNLSGAFYCSREALPYMIREKCGKIVNIASMWGEVGASLEVHYSVAKAGIIGLTKALAKEVGLSGVTVNAVSPGVIMTDMMSSFAEETVSELKEETPLNKLGKPGDIANAVKFLLSEEADFITGQVLSVNGGFVI